MFQAHGVVWLDGRHRLIRKLKETFTPSVHGHKTWGSSYLVMDYLLHNPIRRGARVMDLGCGWAPGGIFCASHFGAKVTGVDVDPEVFPYAEVLAALNDVRLSFDRRDYEKLPGKVLGRQDLIIGSDICFWEELVDPLAGLVRKALKGGTRRIVVADPGRAPFHRLAEKVADLGRVRLMDWYTEEPERVDGEILEIRPARAAPGAGD